MKPMVLKARRRRRPHPRNLPPRCVQLGLQSDHLRVDIKQAVKTSQDDAEPPSKKRKSTVESEDEAEPAGAAPESSSAPQKPDSTAAKADASGSAPPSTTDLSTGGAGKSKPTSKGKSSVKVKDDEEAVRYACTLIPPGSDSQVRTRATHQLLQRRLRNERERRVQKMR